MISPQDSLCQRLNCRLENVYVYDSWTGVFLLKGFSFNYFKRKIPGKDE